MKPAHLSYKCTVCTASFEQYQRFENHVYTAHSGGAKRENATGASTGSTAAGLSQNSSKQPIDVSDEITIIAEKKNTTVGDTSISKVI